jgi:hypothetical protein
MGCGPSKQTAATPHHNNGINAPNSSIPSKPHGAVKTQAGNGGGKPGELSRQNSSSSNSKGKGRRKSNENTETPAASVGGSAPSASTNGKSHQEQRQQPQHQQSTISTNDSSMNGGSHHKMNGGGSHVHPLSSTTPLGTTTYPPATLASPDHPRWTALWAALYPKLLDPADVHFAIEDLMAQTTNKLSATEVTFLQRRMRSVVRSTTLKTNAREGKMMGRILNNNNNNTHETEGRAIAERYHLLSPYVVKKILPSSACWPPGKATTSSLDPAESTYLLMLHLHESLWDRVAGIAAQSAKTAGLEMDVNKQKPIKAIPPPCTPSEEAPEDPPGASFHALVFMVALALRK